MKYTQGPRTTADSIAEGRMKVGVSNRAKRNIIKNKINSIKKGRGRKPLTEKERKLRHQSLYGTSKLPPRGTGLYK